MTPFARALPIRESRGLFEGVVGASVLLHVVVVLVLPTTRSTPAPLAPSVIEVAELPSLPEPTPPIVEPTPEPAPAAPRTLARVTSARSRPEQGPAAARTETELPADFTETVLSSADGPGVAIPVAAGAAITTSASARPASAATGPRFVAEGALSKPPSAPRLDAALEKHYPAEARRTGISGSAVLRVQILHDGRVGVVRRVSETYAGFGDACDRTIKSGVWEPATDRGGRPVATEITYTCRFEVRS